MKIKISKTLRLTVTC